MIDMHKKQVFSRRATGALAATALYAVHFSASATNFMSVAYDAETDELIVEIAYRGTHENHNFTIQ